jgi:arsenate reductase
MKPKRVLVLCTGNSARSVLAEALLNHLGYDRFLAFSAGSLPTGKVNPFAIETLRLNGVPVGTPRSKSWDEFAQPGSEPIDIVITVCSNAAGEVCPIWPGHPMTAHWGVDDPAAVEGSREQVLAAFNEVFVVLKHRVEQFVALNTDAPDEKTLKRELARIGTSVP